MTNRNPRPSKRVELDGHVYVLERTAPRPRTADSMTTSIKFSADEFERLALAAHRSGMTRHAIMKLAVLYYLDGIEREDVQRVTEAMERAPAVRPPLTKTPVRPPLTKTPVKPPLTKTPAEPPLTHAAATPPPSQTPLKTRYGLVHEPSRATPRDTLAQTGPRPGQGLTAAMARLIGQGVNPLRAVRGGRGFTTLRLAARLNDLGHDIDERLITQIEEGKTKPTPELLAALAKALGVEVGVLGDNNGCRDIRY